MICEREGCENEVVRKDTAPKYQRFCSRKCQAKVYNAIAFRLRREGKPECYCGQIAWWRLTTGDGSITHLVCGHHIVQTIRDEDQQTWMITEMH